MEENKEYHEEIIKKEETINNDEKNHDQEKKDNVIHEPNKSKAYPIRNFLKEIKRIT